MDQIDYPKLSLADYIAIRERQDFLVVRVEMELKGNIFHIFVPENENALTAFNKGTRFWLERHGENKGYWRWPAGGCALFVQCSDGKEALLTVYRSSSAPVNPNTETIGSGLGTNENEIAFPLRTAVREGVEEIIMVAKDQIFYPEITNDFFGFNIELQAIARTGARLFPEFRDAKTKAVSSKFIKFPDSRIIRVHWRGEEYTTNALFNIKENIRGLDVLTALKIKLPCGLDELVCRDGEVAGGNPLDRSIRAYEVLDGRITGKVIASWENGKSINPPETPWPAKLNPNLKQIVESFNNMKHA